MENYTFGKYLYFDYLIKINYQFFNEEEIGFNIREINDETLKNIDDKLEILFNNNSFDEKITNLCNTIGYIWLIQPFKDGNTRTLLIFMKEYLNNMGYSINLNDKENIFPTFYYEDEKCSKEYLNKIKKRIKKI